MKNCFQFFGLLCCLTLALARAAYGVGADEVPSKTVDAAASEALPLRAEAQVDSQGVYLDQVIGAPTAHIRLADAPAFGTTVFLTRARIAEILQKQASSVVATNWSGAAKVKVMRISRSLGEEEITGMITGELQREAVRDRGELEVHCAGGWTPIAVPNEALTVRIVNLPPNGLASSCMIRFELRCGNEVLGNWPFPLQAHLWHDVWVAQTALHRGDRAQVSGLAREKRDLLMVREAYMGDSIDDLSLELTENILAGAPLLNRSLRVRPVVRRGKMVDAVVQAGALTITVKAQALEDGLAGQSIRLRNSKSGREFHGKVQNEDTIEVTL